MTLRDLILSSKCWIAVEAAGTADRSNKPAYDNAAWVEIGGVSKATIDSTATGGDEVWIPVNGVMALHNIHDTKRDLKITATLTDMSVQIARLMFGATVAVNTAFVPLSGKTNRKVWVKFETVDEDNASVFLLELFCNMKLTGAPELGEGVVRPEVEFRMLNSDLNVANVPTASGF